MTTHGTTVLLTVALLGATPAMADDTKLATTLRGVMESHLRAYDAEDPAEAMRSVHSRSPQYRRTERALPEQFRDLDLTVQLTDFRYIGHDDEFAVARVKTRLVGAPGSGFADNLVDSMVLFHQEGGVWKVWDDEVLGVWTDRK